MVIRTIGLPLLAVAAWGMTPSPVAAQSPGDVQACIKKLQQAESLGIIASCSPIIESGGRVRGKKLPRDAIAGLFLGRGVAYYLTGAYDEAIADLDEYLSMKPRDANAYGVRAGAYLCKGEIDRAFEDLERGIEADPKNGDVRASRAQLLEFRGEYAAALADSTVAGKLNAELYANNAALMLNWWSYLEEIEREGDTANWAGPLPKPAH